MSDSSGAEYDGVVDRVRRALHPVEFFHGAWQMFVSELGNHGVLVPDDLSLIQHPEVNVEEVEFAVDMTAAPEQSLHPKQDYNVYFLAGGGVVVLISGIAIFFLYRRYRRLSEIARQLCEKKQLRAQVNAEQVMSGLERAQVISDLQKQASTVRHDMEEVQHARDAVRLEKEALAKQQSSSMCPAISDPAPEQVDSPVEVAKAEILPTLLATPPIALSACQCGFKINGHKDGKM